MTQAGSLERRLEQLGDTIAPEPSFADDVMNRIAETAVAPRRTLGQRLTESVLKPRRLLVAACLIAIAVFWSLPSIRLPGTASTPWWAGPSAAYAEAVSAKIEQARIDGIVARALTTFVMDDGSREVSSTVRTYFFGHDRYRLDIYDDGKLREIQWYAPEGQELVQTSYRVADGSTNVDRHEKTEASGDPITALVSIVRHIDQADKRFDAKQIEGHECVGFEITADKISAPSDSGVYRVWFDTKTELPVLVEFDRPTKVEHMQRMISTFDRFEWNPRLPADTFAPHPVPNAAELQ